MIWIITVINGRQKTKIVWIMHVQGLTWKREVKESRETEPSAAASDGWQCPFTYYFNLFSKVYHLWTPVLISWPCSFAEFPPAKGSISYYTWRKQFYNLYTCTNNLALYSHISFLYLSLTERRCFNFRSYKYPVILCHTRQSFPI